MTTEVLEKPGISQVTFEIETDIMNRAEEVLETLGISYDRAVNLFTRQIVMRNAFPIELKLTEERVLKDPIPYLEDLTEEEFDAMIQEAADEIARGEYYTSEEMWESVK